MCHSHTLLSIGVLIWSAKLYQITKHLLCGYTLAVALIIRSIDLHYSVALWWGLWSYEGNKTLMYGRVLKFNTYTLAQLCLTQNLIWKIESWCKINVIKLSREFCPEVWEPQQVSVIRLSIQSSWSNLSMYIYPWLNVQLFGLQEQWFVRQSKTRQNWFTLLNQKTMRRFFLNMLLCHSYLLGISSKIGGEWGNMDFFGIDVLFFDDHFWQDEVDKSKSVFS